MRQPRIVGIQNRYVLSRRLANAAVYGCVRAAIRLPEILDPRSKGLQYVGRPVTRSIINNYVLKVFEGLIEHTLD